MKNVHLIPTDKPSRLGYLTKKGKEVFKDLRLFDKPMPNILDSENQNIYITSDEEINGLENNIWVYNNGRVWLWENTMALVSNNKPRKIILTTDQDLDGVQAIDDDFLEFLVQNPSCERVEIKEKQHFEADKSKRINPLNGVYYSYKIILPKEEPKQDYSGVHFRHCYQGEYEDSCKYGEDNCPAKPKEEPKQEFTTVNGTSGCTITVTDEKGKPLTYWGGLKEIKSHSFCETPEEKCTMNYCDENGCQNRKRQLTDLEIAIRLEEIEREEPTQETIEGAAENHQKGGYEWQNEKRKSFTAGAKSDAARDYWFEKFQEQGKNKFSEAEKPQLNIGAVSRSTFLMPIRWFEKMSCKHKNKTEIFRCYQDRYVSEVCNICGKVIYSEL